MTDPDLSAASDPRRVLLRQVLSYGIIGVTSALLDATVFWLLFTFASAPAHVANVVGISCGISLSFSLNRIFTFDRRDRVASRFAVFFAVGLGGMALSAVLLEAGMLLGFPAMGVKLFTIPVVAALQFVLNRTVTFRSA